MAFWRGAFEPTAFWTGEVIPLVLDNPVQISSIDFDEPTALGVPSYVAQPLRAEVAPVGFASVGVARGFVLPATLGEIEAEGFAGGIVTPVSYNAISADVNVEGRWPGTGSKPGGLLDNAYDPDGDPLSFEIMSLPAHGTLQVEFNSAFLYTPNQGFSGLDGFTWRPWANGVPGNTVAVTLIVEQNRVVSGGEVSVTTFAPTFAPFGLNGQAVLGEVTATGFASVGLASGFDKAATLAEIEVLAGTPTLPTDLQALGSAVDVVGFAGVLTTGWLNQATRGVGVDPAGFAPILSTGFNQQHALTAQVDVVGFASATVGFVQQPATGFVTVTGFAPAYLEVPLVVANPAFVTVSGFFAGFNNITVLPPPAPERPPDTIYYDPRNHLPAGRRLDREIEDDLMEYWASVDYRVLTAQEIALICGSALPNPIMKREFGTGLYPRKTGTY